MPGKRPKVEPITDACDGGELTLSLRCREPKAFGLHAVLTENRLNIACNAFRKQRRMWDTKQITIVSSSVHFFSCEQSGTEIGDGLLSFEHCREESH